MNKKDFYYDLPKELIAQHPSESRDASRLMVVDRNTGHTEHKMFKNIIDIVKPGDCLVVNDSKVIPARLHGTTSHGDGGMVEVLLHERIDTNRWNVLTKPGRKARVGDVLTFGGGRLVGTVEAIIEDGLRIIRFEYDGVFENILDDIGEMPLPGYIHEKQDDNSRYNTVYAKNDGSVAAPTAGLHFTNEILEAIKAKGVQIVSVTLHVGIGTFRPVSEDDITKHHMHSEWCRIEPETAQIINQTKQSGGRVIAIGTTSCRTLESMADDTGHVHAGSGKTDIFIYPGYRFKIIDGLFTNFHLPESTLIMLVSAFVNRQQILAAYNEAVKEHYRFFSYGDAMLLI